MTFDSALPLGRWSAACVGVTIAFAAGACTSQGVVSPKSPEAVVESFLSAVRANSLDDMGALWGTSRGPNARRMDREELEKRLTVIRIYLEHESVEFVPGGPGADVTGVPNARAVHARLTRRGCTPVVPFTLVPYDGGWLISDIDLSAAGNPARPCIG